MCGFILYYRVTGTACGIWDEVGERTGFFVLFLSVKKPEGLQDKQYQVTKKSTFFKNSRSPENRIT